MDKNNKTTDIDEFNYDYAAMPTSLFSMISSNTNGISNNDSFEKSNNDSFEKSNNDSFEKSNNDSFNEEEIKNLLADPDDTLSQSEQLKTIDGIPESLFNLIKPIYIPHVNAKPISKIQTEAKPISKIQTEAKQISKIQTKDVTNIEELKYKFFALPKPNFPNVSKPENSTNKSKKIVRTKVKLKQAVFGTPENSANESDKAAQDNLDPKQIILPELLQPEKAAQDNLDPKQIILPELLQPEKAAQDNLDPKQIILPKLLQPNKIAKDKASQSALVGRRY